MVKALETTYKIKGVEIVVRTEPLEKKDTAAKIQARHTRACRAALKDAKVTPRPVPSGKPYVDHGYGYNYFGHKLESYDVELYRNTDPIPEPAPVEPEPMPWPEGMSTWDYLTSLIGTAA
jgi:hypothetical protein